MTIFLYLKNITQAPLRIVSFIILYLLITGFVLSLPVKEKSSPPALLIDYSASMTRYFPAVVQQTKRIGFPHSRFFFSESLIEAVPEGTLPAGTYTDITRAVRETSKMQPSAILLISDGNHNYGSPPFSIIENVDMPIYCFGVGTETRMDAAIIDVNYPEYAFMGDSVNVEVIVQSQGFEGGEGDIHVLSIQKKSEHKKSFLLSAVKAKNKLDFWIHTSQLGEEKFLVRLKPQPGEETYENNEFEFSLKILKDRLKVLYYTEHLSFNTKFVLRALEQDDRVEFLALSQIGKDRYHNLTTQQQVAIPELNQFDVLLLDNVAFQRLPWKDADTYLKQGLGIACIGTIENYTNSWREVLPITTAGLPLKGKHRITIVEPFSCLTPGDEYPPLTYINRVMSIKENAVIIAEVDNIPIIAYSNYGQGIIFQISGVDMGTWHFIQHGLTQRNLLLCLMSDIVRFISPEGKHKRLILRSMRSDYLIGETIELTAQSYDPLFRRAGGGDFFIQFDGKRIPFFEVSKGIYNASFVAERSGVFRLAASGKLNTETLGSNELEIKVSSRPVEIEQGLNQEVLQTLSSETGGMYYSIDDLDTFEIPVSQERHTVKRLNLDSPISYIVLLCLLVIDWFLRRRQGIV